MSPVTDTKQWLDPILRLRHKHRMAAEIKSDQRIARLAPLAEVLAYIDSHVNLVAASRQDIASARGLTLAEDVFVARPLPAQSIALRDGYAVESEATRDASSYAPVMVSVPTFVNAGEGIPSGTDAILPQEVVSQQGTTATILSPATAGDGVLPKGADADPEVPLFCSGQALRDINIAILQAAAVAAVNVRAPRFCVLRNGHGDDRILDAAQAWMTHAVAAAGGYPISCAKSGLETILRDKSIDAVIAIGGTGTGQHDVAVRTLARIGQIAFHGVAITPGETAAFGLVEGRPVLLCPGRLDAALACWLFIGERSVARLSGRQPDETGRVVRLTRKISSSLGMTELIPVSCKAEDAEPLGSNALPLQTLARADGWVCVPPQSEGHPAGTAVIVRPLP